MDEVIFRQWGPKDQAKAKAMQRPHSKGLVGSNVIYPIIPSSQYPLGFGDTAFLEM